MPSSQSVSLAALGTSPPMFFGAPAAQLVIGQTTNPQGSPLLPAILVNLSPGASITYNIEVTGIRTAGDLDGRYPSGEPWNSADSTTTGLAVSTNYTFQGSAMACRINITSYGGGTLEASLVQP